MDVRSGSQDNAGRFVAVYQKRVDVASHGSGVVSTRVSAGFSQVMEGLAVTFNRLSIRAKPEKLIVMSSQFHPGGPNGHS
jgi:hypothetical protein